VSFILGGLGLLDYFVTLDNKDKHKNSLWIHMVALRCTMMTCWVEVRTGMGINGFL